MRGPIRTMKWPLGLLVQHQSGPAILGNARCMSASFVPISSSPSSSRALGSSTACASQALLAAPGSTSSASAWHHAAWLALLPFSLVPVLALADQSSPAAKDSGFHLLSLEKKRRIFFKYERRIRDNSPLEKVYHYFSSQEKDGVKYMTPLDLLAAIVPTYPPSQSQQERSGSLDGEPAPHVEVHPALKKASETMFKVFDVDGDGQLSFWEYRLVLTLLAIPEADVATVFNVVDLDGSGYIDSAEFQEMMALLQETAQVAQTSGKAPQSRLGKASGDTPQASGLLVSFFGADQKGKLKLQQFMKFLSQLHKDLVELEFAFYDVKDRGSIPGVDFARSLVAVADIKTVDGLMDKADNLPASLLNSSVSKKDFCAVVGLAHRSHNLEVALHFHNQLGRAVSWADLDKMLIRMCGVKLSPQVLDIVMHLFSDASGNLDCHTFIQMLQRRAHLWSNKASRKNKSYDDESEGQLARMWSCFTKCTSKDY